MQSNKQSSGPSEPITLYNAVNRYEKVLAEVEDIENKVADLKDNAHPGVFDIFIQLSMLKTVVGGASDTFESGKPGKVTVKSIRMLTNLETLTFELSDIVKDARAELLPEQS